MGPLYSGGIETETPVDIVTVLKTDMRLTHTAQAVEIALVRGDGRLIGIE